MLPFHDLDQVPVIDFGNWKTTVVPTVLKADARNWTLYFTGKHDTAPWTTPNSGLA